MMEEGGYDRYEAYRYEASKDNPRTSLLEELSPGYAAPVRVIA